MANTDLLKNIRVVLCGTAHPGNIGAAARAMKTMGITDLWLVAPQRFPDREATWRASRADDVLEQARVVATLPEALEGVAFAVACAAREREIAVPAVDARAAARRLVARARRQPVALVFGNETSGLTAAEVDECQLIGTIPANPEYSSLNLAAAVQVMTYEARLAAGAALPRRRSPVLATHEQLAAFFAHLDHTMVATGFLNPKHPKKLAARLRRLFNRAALEPEEVNILRGLLKACETPKPRRVAGPKS